MDIFEKNRKSDIKKKNRNFEKKKKKKIKAFQNKKDKTVNLRVYGGGAQGKIPLPVSKSSTNVVFT